MEPSNTLARGLMLLMLFDADRPVLTAAEIAERLGMPRSTVYRFIRTLVAYGFLQPDTRPAHFRIGPTVLSLARLVVMNWDLTDVARPHLERLREQVGETTMLLVAQGSMAVCIERVESRYAHRLSFQKGQAQHLHSGASAQVLLAYLPPEEQERILTDAPLPRFTERTLTDPERLRQRLQEIRAKGYAETLGEVEPGIRAIAAPVLDKAGRLVCGVSVAGPEERLTSERVPEVAALVKETARRIQDELWLRDL